MKLQLVMYTCASCRSVFDAPALPNGAYGEFLLWSRHGELAYLNAFVDTSLKEVDNFLSHSSPLKNRSPLDRSKILHRVYGRVACDVDERGAPFEINAYPPCPSCGNSIAASWELKDPPRLVAIVVPPVTHRRWSSLSDSQKEEWLNIELVRAKLV